MFRTNGFSEKVYYLPELADEITLFSTLLLSSFSLCIVFIAVNKGKIHYFKFQSFFDV